MKKIEMLFYKTIPGKKEIGFKFVLFEITTDESEIIHDWGFSNWNGSDWDPTPGPDGFSNKVVWWSNTVDPQVLLKEKGRIVKI